MEVIRTQVLVCGGGIAGSAAAIAAGRQGAEVLLCERSGCLGGSITSSLIGFILDGGGKGGLAGEIIGRIEKERARDGAMLLEAEKVLLEELCREAGVKIRYYTRVVRVEGEDRRIRAVYTAGPDGERRIEPDMVIDATGNGEVSALAGCSFDLGNEKGQLQPMSVIGLISGLPEEASEYVGFENRHNFGRYLESIGVKTSLGFPNLHKIGGGLHALSINHEYGIDFQNTEALTEALMHGRRELYDTVLALRESGGLFGALTLVQTPELIGIREGRRIHGDYTVTLEDVLTGRQHEDAVCRVTYWVDIHALTGDGNRSYTGDEIACRPYDIPFRALIARDMDNLLLAGRCLSGDFYAHASYRVAGNMLCTGEAAGIMAARSVKEAKPVRDLTYRRAW